MAEHSLNSLAEGPKPLSNPEKFQIIVHLEPEQLQDRPQTPTEHFNGGECDYGTAVERLMAREPGQILNY